MPTVHNIARLTIASVTTAHGAIVCDPITTATSVGPGRATLLDVSGQVPPDVVSSLAAICRASGAAGRFSVLQKQVQDIIADGYAAQQVLLQLQVRRARVRVGRHCSPRYQSNTAKTPWFTRRLHARTSRRRARS
jgi:hypothetical protein